LGTSFDGSNDPTNSVKALKKDRVLSVGVSHLKETPTPGPICLIWTFMQFCCSLFDFCAIYFTTKTLFVRDCAPFIRRI